MNIQEFYEKNKNYFKKRNITKSQVINLLTNKIHKEIIDKIILSKIIEFNQGKQSVTINSNDLSKTTTFKRGKINTTLPLTPKVIVDIVRNVDIPDDQVITIELEKARSTNLKPSQVNTTLYEYENNNLIPANTDKDTQYYELERKLYTLGNSFINSMKEVKQEDENYDSQSTFIISFTLSRYPKTNKYNREEGAFFPYELIDDEPLEGITQILERHQIYSKDKTKSKENCLINTLRLANVKEEIIQDLQLRCRCAKIAKTELANVAKKYNLNLRIKSKNRTITFKGEGPIIEVGLLYDHYFLNEKVEISIYAIENYQKLKHFPNWWKIKAVRNNKPHYDKRTTTMYRLIEKLMEHNLLTKVSITEQTINYMNKYIDEDKMILTESQYKPIEPKKNKSIKPLLVVFDIESTTDGDRHTPYMLSYAYYYDKASEIKTLVGSGCVLDFLFDIRKQIAKIANIPYKLNMNKQEREDFRKKINKNYRIEIMAHNITYDIQFLIDYVKSFNPIFRGKNKICGGSFRFSGLRINIRDSIAIIDKPLHQFGQMFNIKQPKEIMPYNLYTEKKVKTQISKIIEAKPFLTDKQYEQFVKNIFDLNLNIGKSRFNHMEYAAFYCERDVQVLLEGYLTFGKWLKDDMDIDINEFLTLSSISDEYFKKSGCYDGCNLITGIARYYIQKTVVGGRCMSRDNKKYNIKKKINDFDGVSLYPSAMLRLSEIGGYLKGTPKPIPDDMKSFQQLQQTDGYFIRINLTNIPKHRHFPLISKINEDNVRMFINEPGIYYMNKITMEDLINYHEITEDDFTIIDGYYFNEGRNNKVGEVINYLFNKRLELKVNNNPAQELYKLIMNTSYGKTILKEASHDIRYYDNWDDLLKYISINHNDISDIITIENKYIVKSMRDISDHYNACHIGSEILAMSKRIMNEVMVLAEEENIKIYYQDTDSMHIEHDKIDLLADLFYNKFNRELIGKNLGQFHCDFPQHNGEDALYAIQTIILGKKAYIDIVKYPSGYIAHFRMKGIPNDVIENYASEKYNDVLELYNDLFNGKIIEFDLLASIRPKFVIKNTGVITNAKEFKRKIKC